MDKGCAVRLDVDDDDDARFEVLMIFFAKRFTLYMHMCMYMCMCM